MTTATAARSVWHELDYERLGSVDTAVLERALKAVERALVAVERVLVAALEQASAVACGAQGPDAWEPG